MKKVKFVCSDSKQRQFAVALKVNVDRYFNENNISIKGNTAIYVKSFIILLLYIVPYFIILLSPVSPWMGAGLCLLMGLASAGIGMSITHDSIHGAYSHSQWINALLSKTNYLVGSNIFNWKIQHNVFHHSYSSIEGLDEDIEARGPVRMSNYAPLKKIHHYQHYYAFFLYGLMTLNRMYMDFKRLIRYNKAGITAKYKLNPFNEIIRLILLKLIYFFFFLGLPIMLTDFYWWQVFLGFLLMQYSGSIVLSTVFQLAHIVEGAEQYIPNNLNQIGDHWMIHEIRTTSNFVVSNPLLNWYISGLNYQIEHHLFPHICHVHYERLSPIVEQTAIEYGITYNKKPSLSKALKSHWLRLKELGRTPPLSRV